MQDLESKLRSLLKGEYSSLVLTFNEHSCNYEKASEWAENVDYIDWISEEEKRKACDENSVWILQWYPDTPIGSSSIAGSTLKAVIDHLESIND